MRYLMSTTIDPFFNLATESYLLQSKTDVFFMYQNAPSLLIGHNQDDLWAKQHPYVIAQKMPVIQRLSDGPPFFHDLNNLNVCYISDVEQMEDACFKQFLLPIVKALHDLSVPVVLKDHHDMLIGSKSCFIHANGQQHQRMLCQGTLLFDGNLMSYIQNLGIQDAIGMAKKAYIHDYLKHPMSIDVFMEYLFNAVTDGCEGFVQPLSETEFNAISELVDQRFDRNHILPK